MTEDFKKKFEKLAEMSKKLTSTIAGGMGQMVLDMIDKLDLSYATDEQKAKIEEIKKTIKENQ